VLLRIAVFLSVALLVACSPAVPAIQRGEVLLYDNGRISERWTLTAEQGKSVTAWLNSHRSGWQLDLLGDYVPQLLALMHDQHSSLRLNVMGNSVIFYDGHHQYGADFGAQDIAELRKALGVHAPAN
jgi:hypothetical protein